MLKSSKRMERLLGFAGRYRYLTYFSWVGSAVSALLALVPFWYLWGMIREALAVAPDFSLAVHLVDYGWKALGFSIIAVLVYIASLLCSHLAAFRIAANLRMAMMERITQLPLGLVAQFGSGRLRKTVNEASAATETYLAHRLPDRAGAIATPLGLIGLLLVFDWRLGLLSLVPVALGFLVMMRMTGQKMRQKMTEYQNALEEMSNEAVEYVRGMPVVKTFGQTIDSFHRFRESIQQYGIWVTAYTKDLCLPMICYTVAINSVFVFLILGAFWLGGQVMTETFLLNLIFYCIITPIISVTMTRIMFQSEDAMIVDDALARMDQILTAKPLPQMTPMAHPQNGALDFSHVTFSYDGSNNALTDVTLSLQPGERVALVGESGSGKSTLAALAARFFDPQEGTVALGGADIRQISAKELMSQVGFVFQNSRLIQATLLENVRLGRPKASREEVLWALKEAQCSSIVEKFPQGVDTYVGPGGVYLSGGEQQRIAIARMFLKQAPVLLLDEATAFADAENEFYVQQAITKLSKGKTVLFIAHRLSTVASADRIVVLSEGEIVEEGTHETLLAKGGPYASLWAQYRRSLEWNIKKEERDNG